MGTDDHLDVLSSTRLAIIGAGRMGTALATALPGAHGPFGRGFDGDGFDAVLLAVPDREITAAASAVTPGRLVGHCAGAWGLDLLAPHEAFAVHPLMTVTRSGASFAGCGAAVAGSTSRALAVAHAVAAELGMQAFEVADADPIARGDEAGVARQRDAIAQRAPELIPLFDAMAERTRALASRPS